MFGIGFFEFLLILLGILLFIKPEELPKFVYRIGKVYGALQQAYTDFRRELNAISHQVETTMQLEGQPQEKDAPLLRQRVKAPPKKATVAKKKSIGKTVLGNQEGTQKGTQKRRRATAVQVESQFQALKRSNQSRRS